MPISYLARAKIVDCEPAAIASLRSDVAEHGHGGTAKRYGVRRETIWRWLRMAAAVEADEKAEKRDVARETVATKEETR
jgi:hypothetical protein